MLHKYPKFAKRPESKQDLSVIVKNQFTYRENNGVALYCCVYNM